MTDIYIKFQNGLNFESFKKEVFDIHNLGENFTFIESNDPNFIIFGPYGNDIPIQSSAYTRIGYFCENIQPDLSICEWAFGVPRFQEVNKPNYARIQWHGINPNLLLKSLTDNEIDQIISKKKKFCNFLYSHSVPYREEFFKQLSKYKKVDAPGKSMCNMNSIDEIYSGNFWERKRKFLSEYKFTIAFENYSYPGYQTEKLYDSVREHSIPVYCGDPNIHQDFNVNSFVNVKDYVDFNDNFLIQFLEKWSQQNFADYRPQFHNSIKNKIARKLKSFGRQTKMSLQFNQLNFSNLIDKIVEIDENEELYISYLKAPFFKNNCIPEQLSSKNRWTEIFTQPPNY